MLGEGGREPTGKGEAAREEQKEAGVEAGLLEEQFVREEAVRGELEEERGVRGSGVSASREPDEPEAQTGVAAEAGRSVVSASSLRGHETVVLQGQASSASSVGEGEDACSPARV